MANHTMRRLSNYVKPERFETSPVLQNGEVSNVTFAAWSAEKSGKSPVGTVPAITCARDLGASPKPAEGRRGGRRNRVDRESTGLSASHIANLQEAVSMAQVIGLPLNRFISLHWQMAGIRLEDMARATGRFIDYLTKWLMRRMYRTAYVWVHENGHDAGWHCHLLAHVPPDCVARLPAAQKRWLRKITGQPYRSKVIKSKSIGQRLGLETTNPELYSANLETVVAYVTKGASIQPTSSHGAGGRIVGKRCGSSQNVGPKARGSTGRN